MGFTYTDRNAKTVLHSWGRFKATLFEAVVEGDLLAVYNTDNAYTVQFADQSDSQAAIAVACEAGAAGDEITCALMAELKAPTTPTVSGGTQTYFAASADFFGAPLYLGESGKPASSAGATLSQEVGFLLARDRILIVPNTYLASTTLSLSSTLTVTGAAALNGGLTMDTNKFTVANTSGNVLTAGTLTVGGASTLTGAVSIDDTTASTSVTTGSLHTDGGCGIAKALFVGENISIATGYKITTAAELTLNSVDPLTIQIGAVDALQMDEAAISAFAGAAATAGHAVYVETEDGGAATSTGAAGGLYNFKTGDGSAAAGSGNSAGGAGGALSLITGAGGAGGVTNGAGGAGGAVAVTSGAGGASDGTGTGGAGGAVGITGGAGSAPGDAAANTAGAGATVTITGGAGGASSGATGTGGAGGDIVLVPGALGAATGGTAGRSGVVNILGAINALIIGAAATDRPGTTVGTDWIGIKSTGTAPTGTNADMGFLYADYETDDDELFWLSGTVGTATQLTT